MKKYVKLLLSISMMFMVFAMPVVASNANNEEENLYYPYENYQYLLTAYSSALRPYRSARTSTNSAWSATYVNYYRNSNWRNTNSIKSQFYCHARNYWPYTAEAEWNLEFNRVNPNPITCNDPLIETLLRKAGSN